MLEELNQSVQLYQCEENKEIILTDLSFPTLPRSQYMSEKTKFYEAKFKRALEEY